MSGEMQLVVTDDGKVRFVWDDALAAMLMEGDHAIERASHVEPTADGRWTADLRPCGGPVIGPFAQRETALQREREWIDERLSTLSIETVRK